MKNVTRHLEHQHRIVAREPEFKIWKSVILGMYSDVNELLLALASQHCCISDETLQVMTGQDFMFTRYKSVVNLVIVSARELGLEGRVYYGDIFVEGTVQGLLPCPIELAAQLRRQYENQPENEFLRVISCSRFLDPHGRTRIFTLLRDGETSFLDVHIATPNTEIGLDDTYVWVHPRK